MPDKPKKKDYRDAYKVVSIWPPVDNVTLVDLESDTVDPFLLGWEGPHAPDRKVESEKEE